MPKMGWQGNYILVKIKVFSGKKISMVSGFYALHSKDNSRSDSIFSF